MKKVLLIGSVTTDVTLCMDHLPNVEEDVNVQNMTMRPGGCVCNIASVFRVKQVPYTLCYSLGTGMYAKYLEEELGKRNINSGYRLQEENGACFCLVDKDGNRTFLAVHGAEYHFPEEMFASLHSDDYAFAYAGGIDVEEETGENIITCLERMHEHGVRICFAPGPRIGHIAMHKLERLLALQPVLHMNLREGMTLVQRLPKSASDEREVLQALHEMTQQIVVITNGENPLMYCDTVGKVYSLPVEKVKQVDGTGAGDCHVGALLCGLMQGNTLQESLHEANHIASLIVGKQGGELCLEDMQEMQNRV